MITEEIITPTTPEEDGDVVEELTEEKEETPTEDQEGAGDEE